MTIESACKGTLLAHNMSLAMDIDGGERRTSTGIDAERPLPANASGLDLCSLAQELRQAVRDSHAAVEGLGVNIERQGEAAAGVLQRVVHALEQRQQSVPLCSISSNCWSCSNTTLSVRCHLLPARFVWM